MSPWPSLYDDRNRTGKTQAFGDMVHLLPPMREFTPIANPYVPGTPLRRNSQLFFGREELFEFIREATLATAGRNVLMLVGQRRTGKTSALLRIQEYLPPHLIPGLYRLPVAWRDAGNARISGGVGLADR